MSGGTGSCEAGLRDRASKGLCHRAVFLDRDGVLVEDLGLLADPHRMRILPGVPQALARLRLAGLKLVIVTNQAAVARGLLTEADLALLHERLAEMLAGEGAPRPDAVYACPHHPEATLARYRVPCTCRKPRPGLLLRAAAELGIDLGRSFMVGDRITDIAAGSAAGCATVLVETGRHADPLIRAIDPVDPWIEPDFRCRDLGAAAEWILSRLSEPAVP